MTRLPDTVLQAVREVTGCGKEVSGVFRSLPMIATNPVVMPTCYQQVLHSDSPALAHLDCDACLSLLIEAVIRQAVERLRKDKSWAVIPDDGGYLTFVQPSALIAALCPDEVLGVPIRTDTTMPVNEIRLESGDQSVTIRGIGHLPGEPT